MSVDRILISASPGEIRIAELDDGNLVGLTIDRDVQQSLVGDIVAGRVEAVIHNLQAAFIDIGEERSGYLGLADARPHDAGSDDAIGNYVNEGDKVLVQITRDPQDDKGAKVTMKLVLTGRDLVFTPGRPGVSLSRRIVDAGERDRLSAAMEAFGQSAGGFILRTAAQEAETEDVTSEASRLESRWAGLQGAYQDAHAPVCLERELEPACRLLRDQGGVDLAAVMVDSPDVFNRIKAFTEVEMPDISDLVNIYRGTAPLFQSEGVEELIEDVLDPWVALPSGGNIRISETDALVAVDVNSGGATGGNREHLITDVNCQAAAVIAREMKVRNLSGLMVIDFITMRREENQEKVLNALRRAVAEDPQRPFVGGFTRFGLVELTRRRKGLSLSEILCAGPSVPEKSPLTAALEALRGALHASASEPGSGYSLDVGKAVGDAFAEEAADALAAAREQLGGRLDVDTNAALAPNAYAVRPLGAADG